MAPPDKKAKKGSGIQRKFRGKMGQKVKVRGGWVVVMRSHTHGGGSSARSGYECGQTKQYTTRQIPGQFRVDMPNNKTRHGKGYHLASTRMD